MKPEPEKQMATVWQ